MYARGFTTGQKNRKIRTGPPGCWAAGPLGRRAAGPSRAVGRGPMGLRAPRPLGRRGPWAAGLLLAKPVWLRGNPSITVSYCPALFINKSTQYASLLAYCIIIYVEPRGFSFPTSHDIHLR